MKKFVCDLTVKSVERIHERYVLIRLTDSKMLPEMQPGQFVEVRVDGSSSTFLRRPISIHFVDYRLNELWLLVAIVGEGTRRLAQLKAGESLNCILPLGNGFSIPSTSPASSGLVPSASPASSCLVPSAYPASSGLVQSGFPALNPPLLVGGGVGVAPLLYLGKKLREQGCEPTFLLGARTKRDLLMADEFRKYGRVLITTEDGSEGEQGFVTNHPVLRHEHFGIIQCCGPTPMMKAVARYAREQAIACEVSLENLMACGLGACLCCVEKVRGADGEGTNVCVCKEGPVFNINRLLWQD